MFQDKLEAKDVEEFDQLFYKKAVQLAADVESVNNAIESGGNSDFNGRLDDLFGELYQLRTFLNNMIGIFTTYDRKRYEKILKSLQVQLTNSRTTLNPASAFVFKSKQTFFDRIQAEQKQKQKKSESTTDSKESSIQEELDYSESYSKSTTTIQGVSNETIVLTDADLMENASITIRNVSDCKIYILGSGIRALRITKLSRSSLICAGISGSALLYECSSVQVRLAARQIRIHLSTQCSIYVLVPSGPIIEDCTFMKFAPYLVRYPDIDAHLRHADLDPNANRWNQVTDFSWMLSGSKQSPNWSILESEFQSVELNETDLLREKSIELSEINVKRVDVDRALEYPYWRPDSSYIFAAGQHFFLDSESESLLISNIVSYAEENACANQVDSISWDKLNVISGCDIDHGGNTIQSVTELLHRFGIELDQSDSVAARVRNSVLALGSNASPIQLKRKFGEQEVVIVLRIELQHYDVAYSPMVSGYGAIPATLVESQGTRVDMGITCLSNNQLTNMHKTEYGYSYIQLNRALIRSKHLPESEFVAARIYAYVQSNGCLSDSGRQVFVLSSIQAENRVHTELSQLDVQRWVSKQCKNTVEVFNSKGERAIHHFIAHNVLDKSRRISIEKVLRKTAFDGLVSKLEAGLDTDDFQLIAQL
uniref:C-CAP/cofactor C-like domain-containing protein n=1 Tax=Timspurckia oligopyrenoides TaxID=708627 RepID=A0A7S0ZJL2_9RHOD|mmetsp:Transcript_7851/g.14240  ORF Transcript_7851/g.14240 Transcript_7851/m.14240 type:complete len:653 (+) Transcript_7851:231-2189(+)